MSLAQPLYIPHRLDSFPRYKNPVARVAVDPTLNPAQRTCVLIGIGQSNIANCGYVTVNVASTNVHNFSVADGGMYRAANPLLGCSAGIASLSTKDIGSNWLTVLGDQLISNGIMDRVILAPIAVAATSIQNWAPTRTPFQDNLFSTIQTLARRLARAGLTPATVTMRILFMQGETDAAATVGAITQAFYQACLQELIDRTRAPDNGTPSGGANLVCPWVVSRTTHNYTNCKTEVRAAQAAIVSGSGATAIQAGPDTDTITGSNRDSDDVHLSVAGCTTMATAWRASLAATGAPS